MTPVREKFINAIESLPYDIDEELKHKKTLAILKDVTQKYVELYGIDDLCENDKICIESILSSNANNTQKIFQDKFK